MNLLKFVAFGVEIACTTDVELADRIEGWAGGDLGHTVCFSDTHAIVKGHDDRAMQHALDSADIVVPDGHPIAWIGRTLHQVPAQRICGPDFFELLASRSPRTGLTHYLFGGKPGVAEQLRDVLMARYPGISIVGFDTPPMGTSTPSQVAEQIDRIIAAKPNVVWIGLGAPKQEIWMAEHRHKLAGITLCGVGAAFDFHTGRVKRAPAWMRRYGLEWAFRAASEPARLGPRYAKTIVRFCVLLLGQIWHMARSGAFSAKAKPVTRRN